MEEGGLSYFHITVTKQHDQGNLMEECVLGVLTLSEGVSMTIMAGIMAAGK